MTRKQTLQLSIGALVALALLFFFLRGMDWSQLRAAFAHANLLCLAAVALTTVVAYLVRAWRWGSLYRPLARVPYYDLLSATNIGFMSALLVPRSGEVLRPYLISRRHAVGTSAGFAIIIIERLIDLITVLLLFAAYLYVLPMPPEQQRGALLDRMKAAGAMAGLGALAGLVVLIAFHVLGDKAFAVADRVLAWLPERLARPFKELLRSFHAGLGVLTAPVGLLLLIAFQSLLLWLSIALSFYWNNLAFGVHLPLHASFLLLAFLTVGVAIPTPGGVGGFHAFYLLAMTQAFGVAHETAAAAGIAAHALGNLPVLILGLVFLGREGLTMGRVAELAGKENP